jgi:hypothetical protein
MKILGKIFATAQPRNRATAQPRNRATAQPRNSANCRLTSASPRAARGEFSTSRGTPLSLRQVRRPLTKGAHPFSQVYRPASHGARPVGQVHRPFSNGAHPLRQKTRPARHGAHPATKGATSFSRKISHLCLNSAISTKNDD